MTPSALLKRVRDSQPEIPVHDKATNASTTFLQFAPVLTQVGHVVRFDAISAWRRCGNAPRPSQHPGIDVYLFSGGVITINHVPLHVFSDALKAHYGDLFDSLFIPCNLDPFANTTSILGYIRRDHILGWSPGRTVAGGYVVHLIGNHDFPELHLLPGKHDLTSVTTLSQSKVGQWLSETRLPDAE